MSRPKPIAPHELDQLTTVVDRLHGILHHPTITARLNTIWAAADAGYPKTASGANPGGSPSSSSDRLPMDALDATSRFATEFLGAIRRLDGTIYAACCYLDAVDPNRPVNSCKVCNRPMPLGRKRCQWIDPETNLQCGASPEAWPLCKGCNEPMAPGDRRKGRCDKNGCRYFFETKGYDRQTMGSYREKLERARAFVADGAVQP